MPGAPPPYPTPSAKVGQQLLVMGARAKRGCMQEGRGQFLMGRGGSLVAEVGLKLPVAVYQTGDRLERIPLRAYLQYIKMAAEDFLRPGH